MSHRAISTAESADINGDRHIDVSDLNIVIDSAVGVAISRTEVTTVLARLDGAIVREETCKREPDRPGGELVGRIVDRIDALLRSAEGMNVVGIGIGDPLYDPASYQKGGSIASNYGHVNDWVHLELKPVLETRFGMPVQTLSAVSSVRAFHAVCCFRVRRTLGIFRFFFLIF